MSASEMQAQPTATAPGLRVQRLRLVSDQPLAPARAQAVGSAFAQALDSAFSALPAGRAIQRLELGELVLDLRGGLPVDALARAAARQIAHRLGAVE